MEKYFFDDQMKRLKSQWGNFYSDERQKALWEVLKHYSGNIFESAINYCLLNCKTAPLLSDIQKAIKVSESNFYENKKIDNANYLNAFLNINDDGITCDKDFKNKCTEHLRNFLDKKITKKQFDEGCDLLDQAALIIQQQKKYKHTEPNKPYKED
jgi:hypothetical protein